MIYDVNLAEGLFKEFVEQNPNLGIVNSSINRKDGEGVIDSEKIAEILKQNGFFVLRQRGKFPNQIICSVRKDGVINNEIFQLSLVDQKVSALQRNIKLEEYLDKLKSGPKGFKPLTSIENERYDITEQPTPRYEEEIKEPIAMEEENKSSFHNELILQLKATGDYEKYNVYDHIEDTELRKIVKTKYLNELSYCFTLNPRQPKKLIVFYKTKGELETKKFKLIQSNGKVVVSYNEEHVPFVEFINAFLKKKKLTAVEVAPQAIAPIAQISDPSKPIPVTFEEVKEAFKNKTINGMSIPFHDTYCDQPLTVKLINLILCYPGCYLIRKCPKYNDVIILSIHETFKKDKKSQLKEYHMRVFKKGNAYLTYDSHELDLEKKISDLVIINGAKPFDMAHHLKYDLYTYYDVERLTKYFADNKISFPIYKKFNDEALTVEAAKAVIQSSVEKRVYMFIDTGLFNTITLVAKNGNAIEVKELQYAYIPVRKRIEFFTKQPLVTKDLLKYEKKEFKEKGFKHYKDIETDPLCEYKNKSYKLA